MATRILYLVRHGFHFTASNVSDPQDAALSLLGVEQALFTAQRFRLLPITAIYYSPLRRAAETAHLIGRALPETPLHLTQGLVECIPSIPAGYGNTLTYPPQRLAECRKRFDKAFEQFFKVARGEDKHEILVCHGNIIRYFILRALNVATEAWGQLDMCNCAVSEVLISADGALTLISHNDVRHLPDHLIISLIGVRRAHALFALAKMSCQRGDLAEAQGYGDESIALFESANDENAEQVRTWMAHQCQVEAAAYRRR
ncbi:MAG TPA: histidine phosphatase family protein [Anaerolineae bacterium]|nr:histidine phosphatase family protein [Anaerolineae bacterium]